MSYAAHLGGKLVYEQRVGVDRTDGEVFPELMKIQPVGTSRACFSHRSITTSAFGCEQHTSTFPGAGLSSGSG